MADPFSKNTDSDWLMPRQVADLLKVSPVTVRRWALNGRLASVTTPGGHRRFAASDVKRFAHLQGIDTDHRATPRGRILIVEDDRQLADYLTEFIAALDSKLHTAVAYNGFNAGQQLQVLMPDLVLLDLMMPGLDGFAVCRNIKRNPDTAHIRVIAMTGYPSEENINAILAAGAESCLPKPLDPPTLRTLLAHCCAPVNRATTLDSPF